MEHQEIFHQSKVHQNFRHILNMDKFMLMLSEKNVVKLNLKALDIENILMNLAGENFHIV